jgi:hypothetical protein
MFSSIFSSASRPTSSSSTLLIVSSLEHAPAAAGVPAAGSRPGAYDTQRGPLLSP